MLLGSQARRPAAATRGSNSLKQYHRYAAAGEASAVSRRRVYDAARKQQGSRHGSIECCRRYIPHLALSRDRHLIAALLSKTIARLDVQTS